MEKGTSDSPAVNEYIVWLGKFQLDLVEPDTEGVNASEIIVHPDWVSKDNLEADIAIILFDILIDPTPRFQPIMLPTGLKLDAKTDEDGVVVSLRVA